MIVVAFIMMYIWPVIFDGLVNFGEHIQKLGSVGAGVCVLQPSADPGRSAPRAELRILV
jgi:hypothetical protein